MINLNREGRRKSKVGPVSTSVVPSYSLCNSETVANAATIDAE
jgi:hypothetical protein